VKTENMTKITLIIFSFISLPLFCQTNFEKIESDLWEKLDKKEITTAEWYDSKMKEAGSLNGQFSAWYKDIKPIKDYLKSQILFYFIDNFQIEEKNGNQYARMFLENRTNESIEIDRIDSTIDNLQEYFYINDKWIPGRKNGKSSCGNSYYTQIVKPNTRLIFDIENAPLTKGEIEVPYKVEININGQTVETNIIKVKLYDSQLKRLIQTD
jgi:hypothetical protein